ncbi:MAG: SdpI family protein, partial [Treponema sp.]|nr:SdpI family protein [Treponema sp.]
MKRENFEHNDADNNRKSKNNFLLPIIISSVLCLVPIVFGVVLWQKLPEEIPMHYDIRGNAGNLAPKWVAVFVLPLYCAIINCVACVLLSKVKKSVSTAPFYALIFFLPLFLIAVQLFFLVKQLGVDAPLHKIIPALASAFFALIGNYFPKISRNKVVGVRVPWTLKSDEVWRKTHRFAGVLWVVCGFVSLAFSFTSINYLVFFAAVFVMAIVPIVYSIIIYAKGEKEKFVAYCGLDCKKCDAYIATLTNDDELRKKLRKKWSELNGVEITHEQINCEGCRTDGVKTV